MLVLGQKPCSSYYVVGGSLLFRRDCNQTKRAPHIKWHLCNKTLDSGVFPAFDAGETHFIIEKAPTKAVSCNSIHDP